MRKRLVGLLLIYALLLPGAARAAGGDTLPGSGWWTGQQVMNIGTSSATIVSTAYSATDSNIYVASSFIRIPAGASDTFLPGRYTFPSPLPYATFRGSAIAVADQPIRAMVTLTNRQVGSYGTPNGVASGQYQGIDDTAAATTVYFPIAKRAFGPKTTTFFVQNMGGASATVTATYTGCTPIGGTYSNTSTSIYPGQMVVMNPSDANVPNGDLCSATMTSSQLIVGVATEHYTSETVATLVQASRGFTSADYNTTIYAPVFKNRYIQDPGRPYSRSTGAQVQNVSGGTIDITAYYYGARPSGSIANGTCASAGYIGSETYYGVPAGGSVTFLNPTTLPDNCLAAVKFVGTGQIVGTVNESYIWSPLPGPGFQSSSAYNLAPAAQAGLVAVAPLYKENFGGKTSGLQVQNVGSSGTDIYLQFRSGTDCWQTGIFSLSAGTAVLFYRVSEQNIWVTSNPTCRSGINGVMPGGTNAAVTIFSNTQPVLAVVNEDPLPDCYGSYPGLPCYDRQNYEAFKTP